MPPHKNVAQGELLHSTPFSYTTEYSWTPFFRIIKILNVLRKVMENEITSKFYNKFNLIAFSEVNSNLLATSLDELQRILISILEQSMNRVIYWLLPYSTIKISMPVSFGSTT